MKRIVALIMVLAMSLGLIGCVPKQKPQGDGNDVIINVNIAGAGYGTKWLKENKARFEEMVREKKYGSEGQYEGVYIGINTESGVTPAKFGDYAHHVVFTGEPAETAASYNTVLKLSVDGKNGLTGVDNTAEETEMGYNFLADSPYEYTGINAGIDSLADLIREDEKANYYAKNGELYSLPTFELFVGASYDKDLFDKLGYYFADTSKTNKTIKLDGNNQYTPLLKNANNLPGYDNLEFHLVNIATDGLWESHKSVGPDGKSGTEDDGLPSSLLEFIALCNYMKQKDRVYPLQFTGKFAADYSDNFIYGLVYSLMGEERAKVTRSFNGEVEAVVCLTGEESNADIKYLAPALTQMRQPKTEIVNVTEETGFYTNWSVERYYSMMLMELFKDQDWFAPGSNPTSGSVDHIGAESNFIYSNYKRPGSTRAGQKIAFLSESSFWYNEASNALNSWAINNPKKDASGKQVDRGVRWYSYPANIANSVTGENETATTNGITESVAGKKNVIPVSKMTMLMVNKKAIEKSKQEQEAVLAAIKDYIEFLYSEDELINTTISQGMGRNMNFTIPENKLGEWSGFYKSLNDLKNESYVLPFSANNDTFMVGLTDTFKLGEGGRYFNCCRQFTCDLLNNEHKAMQGFKNLMWSPEAWKGYYKGTNVNGVKYIVRGDGSEVKFRPYFEELV